MVLGVWTHGALSYLISICRLEHPGSLVAPLCFVDATPSFVRGHAITSYGVRRKTRDADAPMSASANDSRPHMTPNDNHPVRPVLLSDLTTMRVGGPAARFAVADSPETLVRLVSEADGSDTPVFVIGSGSNVLVGDGGFDGLVVKPVDSSVVFAYDPVHPDVCHATCSAGTCWDDFVAASVDAGLSGVEALSGIPGLMGSAVMQNIGAYGQEMRTSFSRARVYDRADRSTKWLGPRDLDFGYRTSSLRRSLATDAPGNIRPQDGPDVRRWFPSPRWIVLEVEFSLRKTDSCVVGHPQLAHALGCEVDDIMTPAQVREAVLAVRTSKAMVADNGCMDHDRWSTGSFFTNPIVSADMAAALPQDAPRYDCAVPGAVKTSAAWLIEHAGFPKGYSVEGCGGRASLSNRHTLALTNRGGASAGDMVDLARHIVEGVRSVFGIDLVPETIIVGEHL